VKKKNLVLKTKSPQLRNGTGYGWSLGFGLGKNKSKERTVGFPTKEEMDEPWEPTCDG